MNKKFKAIKNIVLFWGERHLLTFPYPIFIAPKYLFVSEDYDKEIGYNYKGKLVSLYFTPRYEYPMQLKTKFPKFEFSLDFGEEFSFSGDQPAKPVEDYTEYFMELFLGFKISYASNFYYKIYGEMFEQSQQILRNLDSDREDPFEGLEDIKIDISSSLYREEFEDSRERKEELKRMLATNFSKEEVEKFEATERRLEYYDSVERYFEGPNYRYGLEESKSLLLYHLGEDKEEGYSGVNEDFFKNYTLRLQLVSLFRLHKAYVYYFSGLNRYQRLDKINLWQTPPFSDKVYLENLYNAERFYLRSIFRKIKVLKK